MSRVKKSNRVEMEWCAVNLFGWAYGNSMLEALDALGREYDGKVGYTAEKCKRTHLRVFKFPKGHRPSWQFFAPVWSDEGSVGLPFWLVEDTMRDWRSGDLPKKMKISLTK